MGQKTHPYGFRLGFNKQWSSRWFSKGVEYSRLIHEDLKMKKVIKESENPNYWYSPWVIPRNPEISRRQIDDLGKLFLGMMTIDEVVEDLDKFTKEVLAR